MIKWICLGFLFLLASRNIISGQNSSLADQYYRQDDEFTKNMMPDSAIYYFKQAAAEYKTGKQTEKLITAYNQIGTMLTRQDKYEEGRMYLGMAELAGNTLPDTNHLLRASTFLGIGVIYNAVGDYNGALGYHYRALSIRLLKLGENNADVATCYGNIGNVYLNKKEYDSSLEAHLKAMTIRKKLFGEKSLEITQSYNNLGIVYKEKKEYDTSLEYFQKALDNKINLLGPEHKDVAKLYNSMSSVYYLMDDQKQGDLYKAKADEILNQ